MSFPYIEHIDQLLDKVEKNPQIRVKVEPNGMTVACYMLQDEDTFAGEAYLFERECRGITFNVDGSIAARTLHKFFNIGEREDTQPQNIRWMEVARIMDKRDGSMITPVLVDGSVHCKTKKTFTSNEALAATDFLYADPMRVEWVRALLKCGMTPTFEWTSPRFPIVLKYDKDELTLLHIRENKSGRYLTEAEMRFLMPMAKPDLFPIVENLIDQFYGDGLPAKLVSWEKLRKAAETREGIEGWIIQFRDGEMVKLKTQWYCDLHHAVTFTRWRDIARAVADDKADDLKGAFALTGRSIEPILQVERKIKHRLEAVKLMVEVPVKAGLADGATPKDMALKWNGNEHFGLIMTLFRGKQPDYMAWYVKNHLENDFGLEVVEVS